MLTRVRLLFLCLAFAAYTQIAQATDILTSSAGVTVSNGQQSISLKPLVVTQEFDGEKVSSPNVVIVIFPYDAKGQVTANFFGPDGANLRLPTRSYYNASVGMYFMTFGSKTLLNSGLFVRPVVMESNTEFPLVKFKIGPASQQKKKPKQ